MASLVELRVELKQWEQAFTKEYRRKPSKNDIRARKDIYMKYRVYSKMQQDAKNTAASSDSSNLPIPNRIPSSSQSLPEFKYNPEDQSTISPPPVSPPSAPTCEESFLVGYFTLSNKHDSLQGSTNSKTSGNTKIKRKNTFNIPLEVQEAKENQETKIQENIPVPQSTNNEMEITHSEITQAINDINNIDEQIVPANYFLFRSSNSFSGLNHAQLREVRDQLDNPEEENALKVGSKRTNAPTSETSSPTSEPSRKRRKLETTQTIASDTSSFQWGNSNTKSTNSKRENFVRMNLRKGKRGAGRSGRRGVKGSSKSLRIANTTTELQIDDPGCIEDADIDMDDILEPHFDINDPTDTSTSITPTTSLSNEWESLSTTERSKKLHDVLENNFGYSTFRPGQEEAIDRIISGKSTLVCIPTGSGKSLIYQLPALLIPEGSIVLVISPLLSLINDQLKQLPACLTGATINSTQRSKQQVQGVYRAIANGRVKLLFISPEKLMSTEFQRMINPHNPQGLGVRIHYACIDEAHCISQWSHNFRPSYLRITSILRDELNVSCILALSATCTTSTRSSICNVLDIQAENVILQSPVRSNLSLSVSSDRDKYTALLQLLQSPQYSNLSSIIIYCMFQQDTEHLASFLQSKQFDALPYHAGKPHSDRKSVQQLFMSNKLRIVVATVAFGMGVDKSDVRAVIHFSMPRSIEAYVQEVGRAGRDNLPALGHLILHPDDMTRSYKLSFADHIDRGTIKLLLLRLFTAPRFLGSGVSKRDIGDSYYVSLPLQHVSEEFDVKKEVIDTLLTYLQLSASPVHSYFRMLPPTSCICSIQFHSGEAHIIAKKYTLVKAIIDTSSKSSNGKWHCDLVDIANYFQKDLDAIRDELNRLQTMEEISYELDDDSCALVRVSGSPSGEEIEKAISDLHSKMDSLQHNKVSKLFAIYRICRYASFSCVKESLETKSHENLESEREIDFQIERYFREENGEYLEEAIQLADWPILDPHLPTSETKLHYLKGDIATMIARERDILKSGLIGARILHGISSPKFPADRFYHHKFWGAYSHVDFFKLAALVNQTLVQLRNK